MKPEKLSSMAKPGIPQLIKYIGNKTRYAREITASLPNDYELYIEPFFGGGAVLGYLRPKRAIAVDAHKPLIDMWKLVKHNPSELADFYEEVETLAELEAEQRRRRLEDWLATSGRFPRTAHETTE